MPLPPLDRRTFLRAAGVGIGLPLLDAMLPVGLRAEQKAAAMRTKRMLLIGRPLGLHAPFLFPQRAGKDYEATRYLKLLQDHRQDFTIFSGMSHRGYPGGHGFECALLTGVPAERLRGTKIYNSISLDQEVASRLGGTTRFRYLALGGGNLSWNRQGVKVPSEWNATKVFKQLFIDGTPEEMEREMQRIQAGHSILDRVRDEARSLVTVLGPSDRERIDLLLTSIREAEQRLQQDQTWLKKPKPKVKIKPFTDDFTHRMLERERQWFDLVHLALQTDSTRVISLYLYSHTERLDIKGVAITHHDASHHGQDEGKLKQLAIIEENEMKLFAAFLGKLKSTSEGGRSLLDQTIVFHGSNLGNASAHTSDNLPILVAGAGFKHAGHVAFDRKDNAPLSNLFVRLLQQMGIELDRFGSSTGALGGI